MEERNQLIAAYFELNFEYRDIVYILFKNHNIVITERHLKRILKDLSLSRRKYSNIADVLSFICSQLNRSGSSHGYRWMQMKCFQNGLNVRRDDVRLILQTFDPSGVANRKARRLHRRNYYSKGPNYIWHLDSYDKLKPYGFCINGCIDGFSRKIVWLNVYHTSSNPRIIGGYYCDAVETLGGCPLFVRGDFGTENAHVRDFQKFLRRSVHDSINDRAYLAGTSTHNTRIESWWAQLRKECTEFWITLFSELRNGGFFTGDFVDKNILQFCFMKIIRVCRFKQVLNK